MIVGSTLVFGLQAAQPKAASDSEESVREALKTAVQAVLAVPRKELQHDFKPDALANIAKAQMKLGDHKGALATLRIAGESIGQFDDKKKNDMDDVELLGALTQIAKHQREAGDPAGARNSLDRMVKLVDSLESHPFEEELIQLTGTNEPKRKKHEMNAFVRCEILLLIAEEQLALGDRDLARTICRRALVVVEPQNGILKPMALTGVAASLHKLGEFTEARKVIEQSRRLANELPDQEEKKGALGYIAQALARTGDLDGALQLTKSLGKSGAESAIRMIVDFFTDYEPGEGWLPTGGIKLTIGAESLKITDQEAARIALPKLVQFTREIGSPLVQARTLSMLAHLQAKAGDFAGATRTTDSIPSIKRKDFPSPSDGFYDAIKPCTMAIIARLQFEAGDKAGASERLHQAMTLTGVIEAADQKIISQIVIIRKQIECNDLIAARTLLAESIALAQQQPEPIRSRSLAMLSRNQIKAGDGPERTRDHPINSGLSGPRESQRAERPCRMVCEEGRSGISAGVRIARRWDASSRQSPLMLEPIWAKRRSDWGPSEPDVSLIMSTSSSPRMLEHQRQMLSMFLHANLGDIQQAAKVGRAMAPQSRDVALSNLARTPRREGKND